jgi:hypothetical protein
LKTLRILRKLIVGNFPIDEKFENLYLKNVEGINGWMSRQECSLLYQVANSITPEPDGVIVEIGSYEGKSSICIARGMHSKTKLLCVDPHTGDRSQVEKGMVINTHRNFLDNIRSANCSERIIPVVDFSVDAAIAFKETNQEISMLFIDGWHSQLAVEQDIAMWTQYFGSLQTVIFDDYPDPEVRAGIASQREKLPPLLGGEGKLVVYTNDPALMGSKIGKYLKVNRKYERFRNLVKFK